MLRRFQDDSTKTHGTGEKRPLGANRTGKGKSRKRGKHGTQRSTATTVTGSNTARCQYQGCITAPRYWSKGGPLSFCKEHKRAGMYSVHANGKTMVATRDGSALRLAKPNAPGGTAVVGSSGSSEMAAGFKPQLCAHHQHPGMVDQRHSSLSAGKNITRCNAGDLSKPHVASTPSACNRAKTPSRKTLQVEAKDERDGTKPMGENEVGEGARKAKASKKRRKASVAATGGLKAGETREEVDIDREDSTATSSCGGGSSGDDQRGTALAGESKSPGFFAADPRHHSAEMYEQSNRSAEGRSDRHSATRARFSIIPRETRSAARRKQVMAGGGSCETTSSDPPAGMAKRQQAGLFGSRKKQRVDRGELSGGVQGEKRESALALTCAIGVGPKKELSASTAYLVAGTDAQTKPL